MNKPQEPLSDLELDKLLDTAASPPQIKSFEAKLLNRMASVHPVVTLRDNVVPFVRPMVNNYKLAKPVSHRISITAALAASLIIGILISNNSTVVDVIDGVTGVTTAGQVAEFAPSGLEDIGTIDGGNQS
ncbi:MAG: hypothetical protein ABI230_07945 [Aestuariivirga sp.]